MSSHEPHAFQGAAYMDDEMSRLSQLASHEIFWREKQAFLESCGYMLRPRYHPEWTPSWLSNGRLPEICEDFYSIPLRKNVIDATRITDGKLVSIKGVDTYSPEAQTAMLFSENGIKQKPQNHCVPILDLFKDDTDTSISYIVMPFLRFTDSPPFDIVNDIVELIDQLLEGLVFMHEHGVAHRDCAYKNLMMDATVLYPNGFHPILLEQTPDATDSARVYPRFTTAKPVKYYFVDFGISSHILPGQPKLVVGEDGLDRDVPELSSNVPYDPFKVDVFILGNFFKKTIYTEFANVEFIRPLVELMTTKDSSHRPDAKAALQRWQQLHQEVGFLQRAQLLRARGDPKGDRSCAAVWVFLNFGPAVVKRGLWSAARRLGAVQD